MPPTEPASPANVNVVVARVTPDVLALLADGVPRAEAVIVAALAGRHPKDDTRRTVMRLAVLEQLVETSGKGTVMAWTGRVPGGVRQGREDKGRGDHAHDQQHPA
jgi:hypothetical protein